jgi:hypothetical protein
MGTKSKKTSAAAKAGLLLPPATAMKALRKKRMRVSPTSAVSAAAAVEYVVAEIIEMAATMERKSRTKAEQAKNERVRVSLKALSSAVRSDRECNMLFSGLSIATGRAFKRHPQELGLLAK